MEQGELNWIANFIWGISEKAIACATDGLSIIIPQRRNGRVDEVGGSCGVRFSRL